MHETAAHILVSGRRLMTRASSERADAVMKDCSAGLVDTLASRLASRLVLCVSDVGDVAAGVADHND